MKPAPGLNLSSRNVAIVYGEEVQPLSKLAAQTDDERAERFQFTEADQQLLDRVLADDDGQDHRRNRVERAKTSGLPGS